MVKIIQNFARSNEQEKLKTRKKSYIEKPSDVPLSVRVQYVRFAEVHGRFERLFRRFRVRLVVDSFRFHRRFDGHVLVPFLALLQVLEKVQLEEVLVAETGPIL